jgi:hypothetical protein
MAKAAVSWADAGIELVRTLEGTADLTIFGDGPTTLARLPDALGGDPAEAETLAAQAGARMGFLETLRAKAHYLMLPERLVDDIRRLGIRVIFLDAVPGGAGAPVETGILTLSTSLPHYVATLGADLGRRTTTAVAAPLAALYEQLTLLWLATSERGQELTGVGALAYATTTTADGEPVAPAEAFRQAAAGYVAARTTAWFEIVHGLSNAIQTRAGIDEERAAELLEGLRAQYNGVAARRVFGSVGGSPILTPELPTELRGRLDTALLDDLPATRLFEDTALPTLRDAILAGLAGSSDAAQDEQLVRDIARNLVIRAGWGIDPDRYELERHVVSTLQGALAALGASGVPDPVAGVRVTPASLTRNIRRALNLKDSDPVGWAQVEAVMREVLQTRDPFDGLDLLESMEQMPPELTLDPNAVDPDEWDDEIDALAAELEAETLFGQQPLVAPGVVAAASGAGGKIGQSEGLREALRRGRTIFSKFLKASTQATGNYVERIIQADYVLQHPDNDVLMDHSVWNKRRMRWSPLGGTPEQDRIREWLTSAATGRQYKPDILDLTSREVFEIKPLRSVFRGLAQLYVRYLIPLNVGEFGFTLAKSLLESLDGAGNATISTPKDPYLPGVDFRTPRFYPLLNGGWVLVLLVAPGVIGYEVMAQQPRTALEPLRSRPRREKMMDAMAAMIAAAAAAAGARNVGGRPFTPDDLPDLFVPAPADADTESIIGPILIGLMIIVVLVATRGQAARGMLPILQWAPVLGGLAP